MIALDESGEENGEQEDRTADSSQHGTDQEGTSSKKRRIQYIFCHFALQDGIVHG